MIDYRLIEIRTAIRTIAETPNEDRTTAIRRKISNLRDTNYEIRDALFRELANLNGWNATPSHFSISELAKNMVHSKDGGYYAMFIDHPTPFRLNRRAIALASEPYEGDEGAARDNAARYNLNVFFAPGGTDVSPWNPGRTVLHVYTPCIVKGVIWPEWATAS